MAFVAGFAQSAWADNQFDFNVPGGQLGTVVNAIARTAHVDVALPAAVGAAQSSGPITGRKSVRDALSQALGGSGLVLIERSGKSFLVREAATASKATAKGGVTDIADIDVVANSSIHNDDGFQPGDAGDTVRLAGTPIKDVPLSIGVVTSDVIQSQGTQTATDALKNVSGVNLAPIGFGAAQYTIRGFNTGGIYVDGMYDAGNGFASVPIDDLERVEVLKGPTSILTGVSDDGGVVNVATKQPTDLPVRTLTLRYGSFGYKTAAFDLGGLVPQTEGLTYRFNVSGNTADQSYGGYNHPHETLIAPALKWEDRDTSVTIGGRYYDVSTPIPTLAFAAAGAGIYSTPRGLPQGNPNYFFGSKTAAIKADASHDFGKFGGIDITINNHVQYSAGQLSGSYYTWGQDKLSNTTYGFDPYDQAANKQGLTERADITAKYDAGFMRNTLRVGYDFLNYKTSQNLTSYNELAINPQSGLPLVAQQTAADIYAATKSVGDNTTSGGYFLDQIDTLDNRLHIFGSVRDDHFYNKYGYSANYPAYNFSSSSNYATSQYGFSWVGGGVFDLTQWMSIYGTRSVGFSNQSGITTDGTAVGPAGKDLSEVGARYFFLDKKLTLTTSFYKLAQTNVEAPNNADPSGLTVIVVPGEESRGFEASLTGEIGRGFNVIASGAINHTAYTNSIDTGIVQAAPLFIGSVWATYTVQEGYAAGLTFGFGAHGNSSSGTQGYTAAYASQVNNVPGYVVEDAMIGYAHDRYSLTLNVNNLSNRYFYYPSFNSSSIVVGQGRNFLLTGKYNF